MTLMKRFLVLAAVVALGSATEVHAQFSYPGCSDLASTDFRKTEILSRTGANTAVLNSNLREPTAFDLQSVMSGGVLSYVNIYFVERLGAVKFYDGNTKTVTQIGTISVSASVSDPGKQSDNGLMGIVLDPNFNVNKWLYLWYIPPRVGLNNYQGRLSRFTVTAQNTIDMASERILIDTKLSKTYQWHSGGPMQFDSYGDLWVALGNNSADLQIATPFKQFSRTDSTQSEEWGSSSTSTLRGGVFRIHPDNAAPKGYTIPSGNFGEYWAAQFEAMGRTGLAAKYRDTTKVLPEIYVKGERSNHSIAVHPTKRWLAYGTVNYDVMYDEINLVSHPAFMGYPYFHSNQVRTLGQQEILGYLQDTLAPRNESPFNSGVDTLPPAQRPAASFSDGTVPNVAIGGPIYVYDRNLQSSVKFPPHLNEKWLVFSELGGEAYIHSIDPTTVTLSGTQRVDGTGRLFSAVGTLRNALQAKYGPDGALYFLYYGGGQYVASPANNPAIVRVDYIGNCNADNFTVRYPSRTGSYTQGTSIPSNVPFLNPALGTPTSFTLNKPLPSGISLNATTGVIGGTPLTASVSDTYVVTATFPDTSASDTLSIVVAPMAPSALSYSQPVAVYDVNVTITANTPSITGVPTRYAVSPSLPSGIVLDSVTGIISGTPIGSSPATNYTVTASNGTGSTTASVNLKVNGVVVSNPYASWTNTKTFELNTTTTGAGVAAGVGRIPVLIRLSSVHAAIFTGAKTGGADVRFSKPDGSPLDYEIESWNTAGQTAAVWVLLDTVYGAAATPVRLHYGNASAVSESNGSRVFTAANGYRAVWHMSEASGNVTDVTSNAIVGTDTGTTTTTGISGPARNFAGANAANNTLTNAQFINVGNPSALNIGGNITMESWVRWNRIRPTTGSSFYRTVIQRNGTTGNTAEMFLRINNASPYLYQTGKYTGSADVLAASPSGPASYGDSLQWVHLAGVYDSVSNTNKAWRLYRNGVQIAASSPTTAAGPAATATGWSMGRFHNSTTSHRYWSGDLDEIRISAVPRSAYFLRLGYKNQKPGNIPLTDLAYTVPAPVYGVGKTVTSNTATLMGTASRYTATGLPAGLSLNASTGAITGTPLVAGAFAVTVTAWSDSSWSTGATLAVTVINAPDITYSSPVSWTSGAAITPLAPVSAGGPVSSYAALDALPTGIDLNTSTGVLSGTPTTAAAQSGYRVTATNVAGVDTFSVQILVAEPVPVVAYTNPAAYTLGTAIATLSPQSTGGPVTDYVALDALPAGLTLNTANGAITGTPTAYAASGTYRIRAQGPGGLDTASVVMAVNYNPLYIPRANLLARGADVYTLRCSGCHGSTGAGAPGGVGARPPLAYSDWFMAIRLRPADVLMHGISGAITVNGQVYTGSMSNRASVSNEDLASVLTYIRVAFNDSLVTSCDAQNLTPQGYSTCSKTARGPSELAQDSIAVWEIANIRTPPAAPTSLVYPVRSASYLRGTTIASNTPSVSGFVTQFSVTPALPSGLTFNPNTGVITGTPLASKAATAYVVSAQNGSGNAYDTLLLAVAVPPGPPTGVFALVGNGSAQVTWSPPVSDSGAAVTEFIVRSLPDSATCLWSSGPLICTVSGLRNGVEYRFEVMARNLAGAGKPSVASSSVIPQGPPGPPRNLLARAGDGKVFLSWIAPVSDGGSPVTGYRATASPGGAQCVPIDVPITAPNSCTITGLTNRSPYTFTVAAANLNGEGDASAASEPVFPGPSPVVSYPGGPLRFDMGSTVNLPATNTGTPGMIWSIEPNLTTYTGLLINTITGRLVGTPVYVSPPRDYVVTALDEAGHMDRTVVNIETSAVPPAISYPSPHTFVIGSAIAGLGPVNAGGSVSGWSISPNLNAATGLFFSTVTGKISGTPVYLSSATDYTVTATGFGGTSGGAVVRIATIAQAPTVSYDNTPQNYLLGVAIAPLSKTFATGMINGYSISPALPQGLGFSTITGRIEGTPTTVTPPTDYIITATGPGGTGCDTVSIRTSTPAPIVNYGHTPLEYLLGVAIPTLTKTSASGIISGYSILPALPSGLMFSTVTGAIGGTPTAMQPAMWYTITAMGPGGTGRDSVNIRTFAPAPTVSYSNTPLSFPLNAAIALVTKTGATGIITGYTVSPTLPAGLVFSTVTGAIGGTPSILSAATDYVVTATGPGGTGKDTLNIAVITPPPTVSYPNTPMAYPVGVLISTLAKTGVTGIVSGYAINPTLPAGLTFNPTTGKINGTPSVVTVATDYVITATGPGGIGKDTVNIATTANPPVLSFAAGPYTFVKNAAVTAFRADNAGGPITGWLIGPGSNGSSLTANTGLTFSPITGKIQGIPVYLSPPRTYMVTANGLAGSSDTETVSVAVTSMAKPAGEATFSFRVTGGTTLYNLRMPTVDANTENVVVTIADLAGRTVWSQSVDPRTELRELAWDGRDQNGRLVAGGMYMVRISATAAGKTATVTNKAVRFGP